MSRLSDLFRNPFSFLSTRSSQEERLATYVIREHERGRALEDDAVVSEQDGSAAKVKPFVRDELLGPLERWFFGR